MTECLQKDQKISTKSKKVVNRHKSLQKVMVRSPISET